MISYKRLALALEFYRDRGYTLVDLPWVASREAVTVTAPKGAKLFTGPGGWLVASAEQSFLEQTMDYFLPLNKKYVAITPCFRDEAIRDSLHKPYFMKVELFECALNGAPGYGMLADAFSFFGSQTTGDLTTQTKTTEVDILLNGVEVGSYGVRSYGPYTWSYGTGLAEPRFGQANGRKV